MKGLGLSMTMRRALPLLPACGQCGLWQGCLSPKMAVSGKGRRGILILGEAPGRTEDEQGKPFVGKAGRKLQECLARVGVDLFRDCWMTNALICRPEKNRTPTDKEITYCNPPQAPIWMGDFSFKPIGEVKVGDEVMGWSREDVTSENILSRSKKYKGWKKNRKRLAKSRVLAVHRRMDVDVVKVTMASGRVIRCTENHLWLNGLLPYSHQCGGEQYKKVKVRGYLAHVIDPIGPVPDELRYAAGYLAGMLDGEGTIHDKSIGQSWKANPVVCRRLERIVTKLGFSYTWRFDSDIGTLDSMRLLGALGTEVKIINWCLPAKRKRLVKRIMRRSNFTKRDQVVSIEPDGKSEVVGLTTTTGNYVVWGYASKNCQPNVLKAVRELEPETIIPLGGRAVKSLLSWLWKDDVGEIGRWVGWRIPCQKINAWVCPTWHPSYVARLLDDGKPSAVPLLFQKHLAAAVGLKGRPWDKLPDYPSKVRVEYDTEATTEILRAMANGSKPVAFDYETTTLKPDGSAASIYSCAVSDGATTISYPWHGRVKEVTQHLLRSVVPKIGANLQFEQRWTLREFGRGVVNFKHDTVLCAHVLDNRQKVAGVKFQAFCLLGQEPWGEQVAPYLKSRDGTANGENRVREVDLPTLLLYGGLDALLEWQIAMKQAGQMGIKL